MYEYRCKLKKVIDGDTMDIDIDLGFGMTYKKQRVRMVGIDTPESRTRDLVERKFGKASKKHLKELLSEGNITLRSHDKGKFGRILGTLYGHHAEGHPQFELKVDINKQMIEDSHAVPYGGGNKEEIEKGHLANREILIEKGIVELW